MKFYDERSRLVQEKSTNHLGGFDKTYFVYSFVDKPIKMQYIHSASGKATQTEFYTYEYDHAGRLLTTKHKLNAGTETLLVSNSYDELGRFKSNSRTGSHPNLKTDYTYNVRSWMKTISNPLFNETLYYQDAPTNISGYTRNYNGNISAMNWKTNDNKDRTYVFNYDNLSRLTSATYLQAGNFLANYSEFSSYDPHGNVTAIQRFGRTRTGTFGLIDNLTMNYNGNQFIKAEDAVSTSNFSNQGDFRNEVSKTVEYEYDKNGNMTKDFNKGIDTISYNSLNLPISLSIKNSLGSATNNYTYSANGKKLKVEMKFGIQTKTTDYVDNMIYENGGLKRILVDGGYIENNKYHFFIQDHLGNNRVVAQADGTVIQTNHYYPFGMTFMEDGTHDTKAQPYKYGGKEFDGERGLNLYDYLARSADAAQGRFTNVDPLAEKHYNISPYVYCAGNPVNLIDPDGMDWYIERDHTYQYNPWLNEFNKEELLKEDQIYLGETYYSTDENGNITTDYRKDGSIMFTNENDAYIRMWNQANKVNREQFAVIGNNGVLVLPDYKNDNTTSEVEDYGYRFNNSKLIDPISKLPFTTLATIHTHQDNLNGEWGNIAPPGFDDHKYFCSETPNVPYFTMAYDHNLYGRVGNRNGYHRIDLPNGYNKVSNLLGGAKLQQLLRKNMNKK